MLGYFGPLLFVAMLAVARCIPETEFMVPFRWLMAGRNEYVITAIVATCLLSTPLSRVPRPQTRWVVILFMIVLVLMIVIPPFLSPVFVRNHLLSIRTNVDQNGVCLQSNGYNCGPASAVTILRRLGLKAEEGELAILAHTSPMSGTPPDILADTLHRRYRSDQLKAEYRYFREVKDLPTNGNVLAIIKFGFLVDHYVAVLKVTDNEVVVGDPLGGVKSYSHAEFKEEWRHAGIVLSRESFLNK